MPLLRSSNNQTTVEEELITFSCSFKGNYVPLKSNINYVAYVVYWTIAFQNDSYIIVTGDENDTRYHVNTKDNCPFTNSSCCHFTTELNIHAILPLKDTMITCITDSIMSTSNTSYLSELTIIVCFYVCS